MDLICPKCQGTMRNYERNSVHVDQCADCRGIFLDRGELEQLMDAEKKWHSGASSPGPEQSRGREYDGGHGYPRRKKKESFLSELFD